MYGTIQKWGNSHAIRLPKGILEAVALRENERVEITAEQDVITIKKANKRKYKNLEELFNGYTGDYNCSEWNTGTSVGKEVL